MCPPYPHACRKRRLKWVSLNNSKKVDPVSVLGRARLRTLPIVYGVGSPTVNFFFSPPAHLCAVTYITGISLHVSLKKPISFTAGIATPPTTMFQSCIPNAVLEPPSNFFRAAYHPYGKHPHQLHTYTFKPSCTQPHMPVFIFWIAYMSSPKTAKYMYFLKIPLSPILSSRVVYITPSLHPIQYFWL